MKRNEKKKVYFYKFIVSFPQSNSQNYLVYERIERENQALGFTCPLLLYSFSNSNKIWHRESDWAGKFY